MDVVDILIIVLGKPKVMGGLSSFAVLVVIVGHVVRRVGTTLNAAVERMKAIRGIL